MEEISRDPFAVCDIDLILELISESKPEHTPGEQTKYHYLTFGWIVEGLVRGVTGDSLREFVRLNIGEKLDIEDEFMIGIPSENKNENENEKKKGEGKGEEKGEERHNDVNIRIADLVLGRIVMPSPPPTPPAATTTQVSATATATASNTPSTVTGTVVAPPLTGTDIATNKVDEVLTPSAPTEEVLSRSFKKRPPSGPSMLMNPTFFNNPRIR